jgi:hypothetical protein
LKIRPDDEGELAVAVSGKDGFVIIDFGKSVTWLSIGPDDAMGFAYAIIQRALRLKLERQNATEACQEAFDEALGKTRQ